MDIVVRGRHIDVSERFREHVTEKLAKADRFGVPINHIDVEVSRETNPRLADRAFEVELTCRGSGPVIRAEAAAPDKYSATDLAWGRLEERLRRAGDKKRARRNQKIVVMAEGEPPAAGQPAGVEASVAGRTEVEAEHELDVAASAGDEGTVWSDGPIVVRLKEHVAEPMSVAHAVESMELVGHDFYLFRDIDTGAPAVVYRRRGFNYGLIRLEGSSESQ